MSGFKELVELKKSYAEKIKSEGKVVVTNALNDFFEKFQKVKALRWRQYTPYFNDGDECIFHFRDLYVKTEDLKEDCGDYGDGFEDSYHYKESDSELSQAISDLSTDLRSVEDALKSAFGDHVMVTVEVGGKVEIDDYDHD